MLCCVLLHCFSVSFIFHWSVNICSYKTVVLVSQKPPTRHIIIVSSHQDIQSHRDTCIIWIFTLYAQNIHHWLTHMLAVACSSLSQRRHSLSSVRQTKSTEVHHYGFGCYLWWLHHCLKPENPADSGRVNWEPLILGNEVAEIWVGKTRNLKWWRR